MGVRTDLTSILIRTGFRRRFLMARATRMPVLGKAVEFALFEDDRMLYLPKDDVIAPRRSRDININASATPDNVVLPSQLIDHFLRSSRYIFIMNSCMCRDANKCTHYPHELGCIFLGRGVTRIPPKMGHVATAEEAIEHMRRAREAGLVHLIGRNKIDSVWLNTGPKEDLLSICNCCECCCLWKMMPQLSDSIGSGVTRMPGVMVTVTDGCVGCGTCTKGDSCFVNAISMKDNRAAIDLDLCKGCGRCVEICPQHAISLTMDEPDCIERSIERIAPLVDVTKD